MTGQFGGWLWLFPLTYLLHIAAEGLAAERFYRWVERVPLARNLGVRIGGALFLVLNAAFMGLLLPAVIAATRPQFGWVTSALGALVAINGLGRLIGSPVTRSYSPGLISGLLLWLPLGVYAIAAAYRMLPSFEFLVGLGGRGVRAAGRRYHRRAGQPASGSRERRFLKAEDNVGIVGAEFGAPRSAPDPIKPPAEA